MIRDGELGWWRRGHRFNNSWQSVRESDTVTEIRMSKAAPMFPQRRILVVDDEPLVCDAVKMMLNFDGHIVETANNGKEALEIFEKGKFDLVITDFAMQPMRGDALALAIKERAPKQPVVMITAYAEMLQSSGNPLKGVDYLISKPFLLENLREAIVKTTGDGNK